MQRHHLAYLLAECRARLLRVPLRRRLTLRERGDRRSGLRALPAGDAQPSELVTSPSELLTSPSELSASPSELSASPSELLASPSELVASPSELLASPSELTRPASPAQGGAGEAAQDHDDELHATVRGRRNRTRRASSLTDEARHIRQGLVRPRLVLLGCERSSEFGIS